MIRGLGLDVVDLAAFRRQLEEPGSTFVAQTFTPGERREAEARPGELASHLAARFAAKEALIKAWSGSRWGAPPRLERIDPQHIEVVSDRWGRPAIALHGPLETLLADLQVWISLSHDGDVVAAVVALEG